MTSLNTGVRQVLTTRVKTKKFVELTPVLRDVTFVKNDVPQSRGEIFNRKIGFSPARNPSVRLGFVSETYLSPRGRLKELKEKPRTFVETSWAGLGCPVSSLGWTWLRWAALSLQSAGPAWLALFLRRLGRAGVSLR